MATAEFNHNDFSQGGRNAADKALLVKFFIKARKDTAGSKEQGRPIFKDCEYVDIKIAGNRTGGACRPATQGDKDRFPEHYAAFKNRTEDEMDSGTPLSEWPPCSRSLGEELAFFHVKTVEQLANMADGQVAKFMGLYALRDQAKLWLSNAEKDKPMWEMDQKVKASRHRIEELEETVAKLLKELHDEGDDDLNPKQKKRRKTRAVKEAQEATG